MRKKGSKRLRVRRICIDERLDEDLVKIGVAVLRPGCSKLFDDPLDSWSEEEVRLIRPSTFTRSFGLRKDDPEFEALTEKLPLKSGETDLKAALWRSLDEGQVYLSGEIKIEGKDRSNIEDIQVERGAHSVVRIDQIPSIKKMHKALYSQVLKEPLTLKRSSAGVDP